MLLINFHKYSLMKEKISKKKLTNKKKIAQKKKVFLREKFIRIPGIDKGKVTILPNFNAPLPEFDINNHITLGEICKTLRGVWGNAKRVAQGF